MSRSASFLLLLLGIVAAAARVQGARAADVRPLDLFDIGAPTFTNFSPRDGVPDSVIVGVRTDRDGFVWIASPAGVARYDGHRWVPSEDPAMAHPVDNLEVDRSGTLWAAFRDHGLARYDGLRWHVEDAVDGLPSVQIRRFFESRDASGADMLWALTWDKGLMQRRDGRWVLDPHNAELPSGAVLSMAQTHRLGGHERLWAGTGSSGLWFREEGGVWQRLRADGFDPGQVEYLRVVERNGREELWISVFAEGVWRLDENGLRAWTRDGGELPTNDVYDIAQTRLADGDCAIWVASRSGLIRIHGDRAVTFDRRHGLPSDAVRGLGEWQSPNGEEVLWLATESGVSRTILGEGRWQTASLLGAHGTGVFAVAIEPVGEGAERLWVGASGEGIGLFEQGRWRYFDRDSGVLPNPSVRMIKAADDERGERALWIGTSGGYLLRVHDGPTFEAEPTPWPKPPGEALMDTLTRTLDGASERWFALRQGGVWRLRGGAWTHFLDEGAKGDWRVDALVEQRDAGGRSWLWATTNRGLARFDGARWDVLGREAGLVDIDLIGARLIEDSERRPVLWIGSTSAGIVRVDVGNPAHPRVLPNDLPAPPDPTAYSALADSKGRIYVCTNNGVQRLTPRAGGYASEVFTRKNGMLHDECNTNAQLIDAHDRFWTGTLGGLTVFDPERGHADAQPKPLRLVDVLVDGKSVEDRPLRVPPSAKEIDIAFALLSWQREAESRFRTQLVGYDAAPGEWSAQTTRSFASLPPGRYRLRIEARDYAGNESTPIELGIDVEATWWQEGWAKIALAAGLLLLGYGATILRTRALKEQRRDLERRVAARTAELNAANARLMELSYLDALTGLANRRRLVETLERAPHEGARRMALIFVDVDYFKEYNDRFGHPAGDEALRSVAFALRECAPAEALVARYGGEEFACLWPDADTARRRARRAHPPGRRGRRGSGARRLAHDARHDQRRCRQQRRRRSRRCAPSAARCRHGALQGQARRPQSSLRQHVDGHRRQRLRNSVCASIVIDA